MAKSTVLWLTAETVSVVLLAATALAVCSAAALLMCDLSRLHAGIAFGLFLLICAAIGRRGA